MKKSKVKAEIKNQFQTIPGVGPSIAEDLIMLGYKSVEEISDADPEEMYQRLCSLQGKKIDRCVLYVFRCAVYFTSHEHHDAEKLKWWRWTDNKT